MTDTQHKTPRASVTLEDICTRPNDNIGWGRFWIIFDEVTVTIAEQKDGEPPRSELTLPRHVFHRFIDWYNTGKFNGGNR